MLKMWKEPSSAYKEDGKNSSIRNAIKTIAEN